MGIFSIEDLEKIKKVAEKSKVHIEQKPKKPVKKSINSDLQAVSATVKILKLFSLILKKGYMNI